MKKLIFALFMLVSLSMMAQENEVSTTDAKLEALKNEKNQTVLQQKIKSLENGAAGDLMVLIQYYTRDSVKMTTIRKMLNKKYPNTNEALMSRMISFNNLKPGAEVVEKHYRSLRKEYPDINMDLEKNMVALAYAEEPNAEKVSEYINAMADPVYKVAAVPMSVELLAPISQTLAFDLATKQLEGAKKLKGQTALSQPLKADPKTVYNEYIDMYAKLLFKTGKNEEAYKYTKEAYRNSDNRRNTELIENYAFLSSVFDANYQEALPILAMAVKAGKFEKRYVDQVRKGYATLNPGKDVDAYIAELQKNFIDKIKMQVSKLMINEVAPDFYVTDVNGKKVSLADFKGKTIVLDFWATWCGPCVASFPAMQMAVNRYASDPNVKFLFIHTWEKVADPLTDAKNFLSKRDYKFDLYMDPISKATKRSPAAQAFKIDGIPAKFIIDGNGRIRFSISGFEGKDEVAVEEVVQMVEMARNAS
jgi:peroxiredoxin